MEAEAGAEALPPAAKKGGAKGGKPAAKAKPATMLSAAAQSAVALAVKEAEAPLKPWQLDVVKAKARTLAKLGPPPEPLPPRRAKKA